MFTSQQDQQNKPKDNTPSMFAPGLFSTAPTGNLFGINNDSGASKLGSGSSFSGGLFGNPASGRPSLVQLGLFPSKETTQVDKNNASTLPAPSFPLSFNSGKRGRLFEAKPSQDTPPEVKQSGQKKSVPIAGLTQSKVGLFGNVNVSSTGGLFNFAKSPLSASGTGLFGLGQTTNLDSKKQQAKDKVQPPKNEVPKSTTPPVQTKSMFSSPLFSSINMELMKANTTNLQNSISLGVNSQQSGDNKPEVKEQPKGGLFSSIKPLNPIQPFIGNKPAVTETPVEKKTPPTQVKQNIQPQMSTGFQFNAGLFNQKNNTPSESTQTQIPKQNISPNVSSLFSNKSQTPSLFSSSSIKPKTDNPSTTPLNFFSGEENKKSAQKKEENKPMLFSGNSFSNLSRQQEKSTPKEAPLIVPVELKKVTPLFAPPTSPPINQFKPTELPKPFQTPTENKDQPKLESGSQQPNLGIKNDKLLFSFTKTQNPTISTQPTKTTINTAGQKSSMDSSKMTESVVYTDNRREDTSNRTTETLPKQSERPFYSVIKPKNVSNVNLFDLRSLQVEQKSQNFKSFLNAKNKQIVNSLKLHFTLRFTKYQNHPSEISNQRQIFYVDLTNLLMRLLSLQDKSYQLMAKFIYRVMFQQKYQQVFFNNNQINKPYFLQYQIYIPDYSNKPVLNESNSKELQMLVEKIISKWNLQKTGIINFLIQYPQIIRTSTDLYSYLFKHLLQIQTKIYQNEVLAFKNSIQDYDFLVKQKLMQLLTLHNKKISKSIVPKQSLKAIVKLIEVNKDQNVLSLSLKVLLNNINLQHEKAIFQEVVSAIKETKCLALLPFRTILYKLKYINEQFLPNPEDLYKYIRGDEWIDWLDIYLSESRSQMLELQTNQPEFLIESLTSISGQLLIKRLLQTKKGISKFFNLLREQNMQNLCYRFLQACIYSEQSIREIDEFYFKKVHFNYEYQQVVEYIVNFNEHIGKDLMNEQSVLAVLSPKISLLTKILEIDIQKIIELQKYIFNQEYNKFKKFKPNIEIETREGQKLVHLFIDLINIYSIKRWTSQLNISRIFNTITNLLKNKKTQSLALAALRINKPSFNFITSHLDLQTINSISELLDQVLSTNYLYDLIIDYDSNKEESLRMQALYPFRFNDKQYTRLQKSQLQNKHGDSMSIYWIGQLVKIVYRQKFNPYLFQKLLSKLYIVPYELESQTGYEESLIEKGLKRYKPNQNKIPPIFEMILGAVNSYNIWQQINKILQFRISRSVGNLILTNHFIQSTNSPETFKILFFALKLLRTLLKLNQILLTYQDKNPENFIIKTLSSINVLSKIQLNNIVSNNSAKNNLLLSILTNIQSEQFMRNDTIRNITWEAEQEDENNVPYNRIFEYIKKNKENIDFEVVNDFIKSPNNKYYENEDNTTTVSLEILVSLLRLYPEYSIEQTLLNTALLSEQDKLQLKSDMVNKLQSVLIGYATKNQSSNIQYKVLLFLYSLKYDAGKNKLNLNLADRIFAEYMRAVKPSGRNSRINQLLTRYFLRDLQEKRDKCELYINPILQCVISNFEFHDSQMRDNSIVKDPRDIGRIITRYYQKDFSLLNLNQMERIIEERAIVEIADQLESLQNIIKIIVIQLIRRKNNHGLLSCITLLNNLIANNQLLLIEHDMPLEYKNSLKCNIQQLKIRREQPRLFLRDPLQLYLTQIRESNKKQQIQTYQKNNVVQWFLSIVGGVSSTISNYTKFTLTIDKNLYSNNPIQYNIEKLDLTKIELFCYLSFGKNLFSAVEMFGKTEADAISIVELMGESVVTRLSCIRQNEGHLFKESKSIKDGMEIIGLCLEWLKSRKNTGELHTLSLIRNINRHYQFLLPETNGFLSSESIKIILSCLTVDSSSLSSKFKHQIHQSIYHLLYKYYSNIKELAQNEYSTKISTLVQEAIPILLVIPPGRSEAIVLQILVNIWVQEFNYQYYFNESRLILELCEIYPEEMVKFKPLTRCSIAQTANTIPNRYEDRQRRSESICWLWIVKVATALTNHPQSILIINEIDQFFKKYKQRIVNVITNMEEKITKGYIEELEAVLELLLTMFSHELWLNFNRPYLEEITYILSQKTIKFFVSLAQGKIRPTVNSNNDKALSQIRPFNNSQDQIDTQDFNNINHENIFQVEMRVKLIYCLRNYCILMVKAFKSSLYVEKYFQSIVFDNNRYFSSFWDNFNKNIICLFNYTIRQIKYWGGMKNLNYTIKLMNNCYNAPHTFVQNGYLTTIIEIPKDQTELLTEVYMLNYLITELATIHYLKEKLYINKYNNLIISHLQNFGRRIKQHAKTVQLESKKLFPIASQPIKQSHFDSLLQIVETKSVK